MDTTQTQGSTLPFRDDHEIGVIEGGTELLDTSYDKVVEALLEEFHVPGLSLAVVYKGWIYSKWTTPIADILPHDFVLSDKYAATHCTMEDALSHRSGLPAHDVSYGWDNSSTVAVVQSMRHLPFSAQPRTKWQYNNLLYSATGAVIERVTGRSLADVLKDWFWEPLGMDSTTMTVGQAEKMKDSDGQPRLARGYYWTPDQFFIPNEYPEFAPVAAAGAMISSANDYALWIKALLDAAQGREGSSAPMNRDLFRDLTSPRSIVPAIYSSLWGHCTGVTTSALGWLVQNIGPHTLISHGGAAVGFGTCLYLLPEEELGFVSMGNTMGSSNEVGTKLFLELLNRLDLGQHVPNSLGHNCHSLSTQNDHAACQGTPSLQTVRTGSQTSKETNLTGSYSHPAYGLFRVELAQPKVRSLVQSIRTARDETQDTEAPFIIHVQPSQRTWPNTYVLTDNSASMYDMAVFFQRGSDKGHYDCESGCPGAGARALACRNEAVLEYLYTGNAAFEHDGAKGVMRLGMELSPKLAESEAAQSDPRAGMLWLDKVS